MTFTEIKKAINGTTKEPHSIQVYLVLKTDGHLTMRLADIENKTLPELQTMFESFVADSIIAKDDLQIRNLSSADEAPNAIYEYDYDSFPEELGLFKNFKISEAVSIEKFDFSKDDLSTLFGYIIYVGTMENGFLLFKKHYPISLIKRDSFLLGARKSSQRFEKLPGDDIIRLNGSIQLLRINETIYIFDIHVLERNLGFSELITQAAIESVDAISILGVIENIDVLNEMTEDPSFARKLSKVKKSSPIFKLGIKKETIVEFSKTNPGLAGKFKYSEDGSAIRLDTKKSKDLFIKLMNDAFLRSELTQQYYEAISKDNVSNQT